MLGNHGRSIIRRAFTPLTRLLVKTGIIPNQVTVTGILLSVEIAVFTLPFRYVWQGTLTLALALFTDSVDGTLVRMTNGGTRFGASSDSTSGRIADSAVFASLTAWAVSSFPGGLPCALTIGFGLAMVIGAGTVPYARARVEPTGVEAKLGIIERTDRFLIAILSIVFADFGWGAWWLIIGPGWITFASFITVTQRIVFITETVKEGIQA